ncbi:MAG TPA: TadE/TadG family type IV pilus assembly protein [Candidatus Acidoferrales bacterium]|nr:TadE/TadG family type IV pilus assembly protein [Candidatus Acidoferrales bacterium]
MEFALVLPILLLIAVGILDFGAAFALRAKLTNAVREGARIAVSSSLTDANCQSATPCSIVASADAVVKYLANAGVTVSCISPASPTSTATLTWTYSCSNGTSLVINRGVTYAATGAGTISATRVTLAYPLQLELAQFLPNLQSVTAMSTQVTMQNLTN